MVKVVNGKSPSISKYYGWSPEFKAFVDDCLVKNPAHRISASEILVKQKNFFAKAEGNGREYIKENLLKNLSQLHHRIPKEVQEFGEEYWNLKYQK